MQKGKNALYVTAGLQAAPGVRINVRSSVHLPDSEAGRSFDPDRQPFRAEQVRSAPRESVTVPLRGAALFLCALFVVFGCLTVSKAARRSELSKRNRRTCSWPPRWPRRGTPPVSATQLARNCK